mmetsp:Transcript_48648/g.152918  ORF Transcript_48648/g.152918 Transcript_48648/m.152918 type:complete len:254 (+) Transcript_48648:1560-2321(+)
MQAPERGAGLGSQLGGSTAPVPADATPHFQPRGAPTRRRLCTPAEAPPKRRPPRCHAPRLQLLPAQVRLQVSATPVLPGRQRRRKRLCDPRAPQTSRDSRRIPGRRFARRPAIAHKAASEAAAVPHSTPHGATGTPPRHWNRSRLAHASSADPGGRARGARSSVGGGRDRGWPRPCSWCGRHHSGPRRCRQRGPCQNRAPTGHPRPRLRPGRWRRSRRRPHPRRRAPTAGRGRRPRPRSSYGHSVVPRAPRRA